MVAAQRPLSVTPIREFLDRLDSITPEFEGLVRWAARRAIKTSIIPARSVDLRGEPGLNWILDRAPATAALIVEIFCDSKACAA